MQVTIDLTESDGETTAPPRSAGVKTETTAPGYRDASSAEPLSQPASVESPHASSVESDSDADTGGRGDSPRAPGAAVAHVAAPAQAPAPAAPGTASAGPVGAAPAPGPTPVAPAAAADAADARTAPRPTVVLDLDHTLVHALEPQNFPESAKALCERVVDARRGDRSMKVGVRCGATRLMCALEERGIAAHVATANLLGQEIIEAIAADVQAEGGPDADANARAWRRASGARCVVFTERHAEGPIKTLRGVGLDGVDALVLDDQPQAWQESDRSRVLHVHEFRVDRDTDVEKERTYLDRLFKDLCADPKLPGIPDTAATRAIGTFPARDTAPGSGPAPLTMPADPPARAPALPAPGTASTEPVATAPAPLQPVPQRALAAVDTMHAVPAQTPAIPVPAPEAENAAAHTTAVSPAAAARLLVSPAETTKRNKRFAPLNGRDAHAEAQKRQAVPLSESGGPLLRPLPCARDEAERLPHKQGLDLSDSEINLAQCRLDNGLIRLTDNLKVSRGGIQCAALFPS